MNVDFTKEQAAIVAAQVAEAVRSGFAAGKGRGLELGEQLLKEHATQHPRNSSERIALVRAQTALKAQRENLKRVG